MVNKENLLKFYESLLGVIVGGQIKGKIIQPYPLYPLFIATF